MVMESSKKAQSCELSAVGDQPSACKFFVTQTQAGWGFSPDRSGISGLKAQSGCPENFANEQDRLHKYLLLVFGEALSYKTGSYHKPAIREGGDHD